MNLKNNQVTVGEMLDYAPAKAVFQRRFPHIMQNPIVRASRSMTLERLIVVAKKYVSPKDIQGTLEELRRV